MTTEIWPQETIELPSKGVFYPEDSPLRSGTIDLYLMTAKHEDILTSQNLIQKGVVLDRLIDALIATKGVKSADLLLGDLNAVMVAARILGYGKDYDVSMQCPACEQQIEQKVNLSDLQMEHEPDSDSVSQFTIVLPLSKAEVSLRLLTRGDELTIDKEIKSLRKINSDVDTESTTRLKAIITAVDGNSTKAKIWSFVDNLLIRDVRYLREQYKTKVPDVDFNVSIECPCGTNQKVRMPIGVNFFWPDARV
jgi:hypothetical protein